MAQALARQASTGQIGAALNVLGVQAPVAAVPQGEDMFDCSVSLTPRVGRSSCAMVPCLQICFISKPVSDRFIPFPGCTHTADSEICRTCYREAVAFDIENGKVTPGVKCCADGCDHVLTDEQVRELVSPGLFDKYERFKANASDSRRRECPSCGHSQAGDPDHPIIKCGGCSKQYCYFHSIAHEPNIEACVEYHRRHRAEEQQNIALLKKSAASCPRCSVLVSKSAGCNHMTVSDAGQSGW
jgi:hypothetical protein